MKGVSNMRITDLLKSTAIELNVSVASKDEAIDKLIALHEKAGNLKDAAKFKEEILKREGHSSTAIGEGIAVPHAKSAAVKAPALSLITVPSGIDYGAPDGKPVLKVSVSSGINKPEELIQKVIDGKAPVYHHDGEVSNTADRELIPSLVKWGLDEFSVTPNSILATRKAICDCE